MNYQTITVDNVSLVSITNNKMTRGFLHTTFIWCKLWKSTAGNSKQNIKLGFQKVLVTLTLSLKYYYLLKERDHYTGCLPVSD